MLKYPSLSEAKILWQPSESWISNSNLMQFSQQIGFSSSNYDRLHRWSIAKPEEFWSAMWDFAEVIGQKGAKVIVPPNDGGMLGTKWFPDASLNFAENLLRGDDKRTAVIEATENGVSRTILMGELRKMVAHAQAGLRKLGVNCGDRVAGVVTNGVEALVSLLATTALGAVWTSCSPDFGAKGIIDRIGQVQPKVLIASFS